VRSRAALLLAFGALMAPAASALTQAWTVRAPGARSGDIVLMTIPDPVHAAIQGNFSRLHLKNEVLEIPYAVQSRPETLPAVRLPGSRPRPTGEAGLSRIDLPVLAPGPFTSVRLRTRPLPFQRRVRIVAGEEALAEGSWVCLPELSSSCVLDLSIEHPFFRSLHPSLRFQDGDNPPLPAVDVEIWRNRESLAFFWPWSGPVHLLAEAESADRPSPDPRLHQDIDSLPHRAAFVELPPPTGSSAAPAFGAAGVFLLTLLGWRTRRRLRPALACALLATLPGAVRADAGRLYSRPVEVPSAGVVRVPLDLATLRHLGADGKGLRVLGPKGEEVAASVQPYLAGDPVGEWGSRIEPGFRQEGSAVVLGADLARAPIPPHDELWLEHGGPGSVEHLRARVEGSGDREAWKPLAEGELFEALPTGSQQKTLYLLTYPPSQDRFLRITIPGARAEGFQWGALGVVSSPPRLLSVPADSLICESARQRTWCRLELPARSQRPVRLALDLAGPEETAVRVYAAQQGGWSPLVQGIRRAASPGSRFVIPMVSLPPGGQVLRIELQGARQAPRVTGATLALVQPVAVFRAASPGRYELRYGDGRSYDGGANDRVPSDTEEGVWIAPGPESARELPPLPPSPSSPAVPLDGRFAAAWPVHAAGAHPGDVVRLEIPAAVYAYSRSFGNDLRLSMQDRQIPYVRKTADEPALALSRQGLRQKSPLAGIDIPLPQPGLPLTTWQVTLGPQAGEPRNVQLSFPSKDESASGTVAYGETDPLLPARLEGDLAFLRQRVGPRAPEIRLRSYTPADLALWRSRDVLVFVWPREGPVVLRAGSDAGAPQYDLEVLAPDLLARPWRTASLGPKEPEISLLHLLAILAGSGVALICLRKAVPGA
jgi:hypothetical protein